MCIEELLSSRQGLAPRREGRQLLSCLALAALMTMGQGLCSMESAAAGMSRKELQEAYRDFLVNEGFRPDISEGGAVIFKREGRTYGITISEKDPAFFKLTLAFSAEDKSPEARHRRLVATNVATLETKVVKAYIDNEGDPIFSVEMFVQSPAEANRYLIRMLNALDLAYDKYNKKFNETSK